jgi:V/A-type H+-transporting ATPase subunit B
VRLQPAVPLLCACRRDTQPGLDLAGTEDRAVTDRQFLKFEHVFEKHFVGRGEDEDRADMTTHAIAGEWLSLLSPESSMHAGEVDIAKKHHWDRVTEAA